MNKPSETANKSETQSILDDHPSGVSADIISQALPYKLAYEGKTVVIKYGGNAMGDNSLAKAFASDVTLIRQSNINPVVIHGGGPQIGKMLEKLGIKSEFRGGLRVTDQATMEIVEMVLAGKINKEIVQAINSEGGNSVGLCGKDGNMVIAERLEKSIMNPNSKLEEKVDLGLVGSASSVNIDLLKILLKESLIPVVAPIAPGKSGDTFNINADTFAGVIAGALDAKRLLFLTDVSGVLDKDGILIPQLTTSDAQKLISNGTITGGMIPKVETCISAIKQGVEGVAILNGTVAHAVILELFTEGGAGTLIMPDE